MSEESAAEADAKWQAKLTQMCHDIIEKDFEKLGEGKSTVFGDGPPSVVFKISEFCMGLPSGLSYPIKPFVGPIPSVEQASASSPLMGKCVAAMRPGDRLVSFVVTDNKNDIIAYRIMVPADLKETLFPGEDSIVPEIMMFITYDGINSPTFE